MRIICANLEEFLYYYFENLRNLNFLKGGGFRFYFFLDSYKKNFLEWTDNNLL